MSTRLPFHIVTAADLAPTEEAPVVDLVEAGPVPAEHVPLAHKDLPQKVAVTVAEVAAFLEVDPRTIRAMLKSGALKGNTHGHTIRILRSSVVDWLDGKRPVLKPRRT